MTLTANPAGAVAACFLWLGVAAQSAGQASFDDQRVLERHMRHSHIPHVALATFDRGAVHFVYGSSGASPLMPDAVFEAASLSKPVFAAAVLWLVQKGQLDLDRPLTSYLPPSYLHSQNPFDPAAATDPFSDPRLQKVTARMVLSHTAGWPNWARRQPLFFQSEPGREWSYSGEGYVYLQKVIETITSEPLERFIKEAVLDSLGMTHSSFVWNPAMQANALDGHDAAGTASPISRYSRAVASSTLYTTVGDYARFVSALLASKPGSAYRLEQAKQVMVSPKVGLAWGLGVALEPASGSVFHWGANPGFQSMFFVQPRTGRGVLFFTDSEHGLDLVDFAVDRYVAGRHPALRFPMLHPKD